VLLLFSASAQAQTYPDFEDLYINDYADILTVAQEQTLRAKLVELKTARDVEFTILTIPSMTDYGHSGAIEPFATGLFNTWGIGNADRNDGVLFLIALNDRKMRIEVGSGYGSELDYDMKQILDTEVRSQFRQEAYFAGIDEGTNRIIYAVTDRYPGEYDASALTRTVNGTWRFIQKFALWVIGIGTPILGFFGYKGFRHVKRTRRRICSKDGSKMYWMTDADEDAHLSEGQLVEERLKSVDYDVWGCRQCDEIQIETYPKWFSKFKQCPKCSYKTQTVNSFTMVSATRSSTGMRRSTHTCNHCGHEYTKDSVIPIIVDTDSGGSSSGGGGSSFGGGSSSGGGASGSW